MTDSELKNKKVKKADKVGKMIKILAGNFKIVKEKSIKQIQT